jgi:hypothetical protein
LTGAEAEGSDIPAAVPMQNLTPQVPEVAEGDPEPMEEAAEEAAVATGGEEATVPPELALVVVVRSPEIQYAEPIRSAPMTEAAASSRGGVDCWQTTWSTRRRWPGFWRRSARLNNG